VAFEQDMTVIVQDYPSGESEPKLHHQFLEPVAHEILVTG